VLWRIRPGRASWLYLPILKRNPSSKKKLGFLKYISQDRNSLVSCQFITPMKPSQRPLKTTKIQLTLNLMWESRNTLGFSLPSIISNHYISMGAKYSTAFHFLSTIISMFRSGFEAGAWLCHGRGMEILITTSSIAQFRLSWMSQSFTNA
jgi:hypothetical protein